MANIPKEEKIEIMSKNEDLGFRWIASIDRFVCPSDYVKDMKTWITVNGEYYFKWKKVF